jgi:chromosome segregation ATPase
MSELDRSNEFTPVSDKGTSGTAWGWVSALLGAGLVGVFVLAFMQHSSLVNQQLQIQGLEKELASQRETMKATQTGANQAIELMRQDLDATKKETETRVGQAQAVAQVAAKKQAEIMANRLSDHWSKATEEQQKQISQKLDDLRNTTEQATARLTDITGQVGSVKTDVTTTRSDLDKTVTELKRVTGDLGVLSGLIATNSKEIQALRELGERDYFEFTIAKSNLPQRVADVQVMLKKVDAKRNRYTVEIVADDKRVEKKDKGINEPVQFYVQSRSKQPYEFVVNQVGKTQVVGYLSTPKVKTNSRS